ncbi:hypothetical protein [Bordetella avium]|uniref:hypothetical protein n=1 Tax=Bordetella avium TaxID=521 RepID=UPI0013792DE4|nr:hypothetical protein [Bordetella avium]
MFEKLVEGANGVVAGGGCERIGNGLFAHAVGDSHEFILLRVGSDESKDRSPDI